MQKFYYKDFEKPLMDARIARLKLDKISFTCGWSWKKEHYFLIIWNF